MPGLRKSIRDALRFSEVVLSCGSICRSPCRSIIPGKPRRDRTNTIIVGPPSCRFDIRSGFSDGQNLRVRQRVLEFHFFCICDALSPVTRCLLRDEILEETHEMIDVFRDNFDRIVFFRLMQQGYLTCNS